MKKISIVTTKKELKDYGADATTTALIVNNIQLYNELIKKLQSGEKVNIYTIYQLNVQIQKTLFTLKKLNKNITENPEDSVENFIND